MTVKKNKNKFAPIQSVGWLGEVEDHEYHPGSTNTGKIGQGGLPGDKASTHSGQDKGEGVHSGDSGHTHTDAGRDNNQEAQHAETPVHQTGTPTASTQQTSHIPNTPYTHLPVTYPEGHPGNANANPQTNAVNHPDEQQETFNEAYVMNKLPMEQSLLMMQAKENYMASLNIAQAMY